MRSKRSIAAPLSRSFPSRARASSSWLSRFVLMSNRAASSIVSSRTAIGPPPCRTAIDSSTSQALPTILPNGWVMSVMRAVVNTPARVPTRIKDAASASASASVPRKAPLPNFTSRTSASSDSAIFLDMMLAVISGMEGTVAVTSRRP